MIENRRRSAVQPRHVGPMEAPSPTHFEPREEWLARISEEIIDPDLPIIDPHHHLWDRSWPYLLGELLADAQSGHNVKATVYVQCTSMYRKDARPELASLGETEFVNGVAAMAASGIYGPVEACAGMVGHVNLLLGEAARPILERHCAAAGFRFKGVRNSSVWDADPAIVSTRTRPPKGLLASRSFRDGFAQLESLGLSFDAWLYHPQIAELTDLARAFPTTMIILDHIGAPLGVHAYASRRADVFEQWRSSIGALAMCENVHIKLGGLGMPIMGFGFHSLASPPSSARLMQAWKDYFDVCIEAFGTRRCMFESNFPVDKQSYGYAILWNAFKMYASHFSAAEVADLFHDTAARVYKLADPQAAQ
jgi:predicted TIM-barrel fold metal-dependent hydrolase